MKKKVKEWLHKKLGIFKPNEEHTSYMYVFCFVVTLLGIGACVAYGFLLSNYLE